VKHRRHRRVEAKGVAAHIASEELPDDCNIENLSVGGLFLRATNPLPLGMPVRVELSRGALDAPLVVSGRVATIVTEAEAKKHDIAPGFGIELDPLTGDTQRRYYALLRKLGLADLADPTPVEAGDLYGSATPDTHTVASNVRGLLDMLSDALHTVKERDSEIAKLKERVRKLEQQLTDARQR
jgi:hypothetical protein